MYSLMRPIPWCSGFLLVLAGLTVGLSCLVSGLSIGAIADANLRSYGIYARRSERAKDAKENKESKEGLAASAPPSYGTVGHIQQGPVC